jgi:hypothetical protein
MHRQSVSDLVPGMVVAKTVYGDDGKLLLAEGAAVNSAYIQSLVARDIVTVYIQDEAVGGETAPVDSVLERTHAETPATIEVTAHLRRSEGPGRGERRSSVNLRARWNEMRWIG